MRWQSLFADLEAQLAAGHRQAEEERLADLTRAELAGVVLVDRLRAARGAVARVHLRTGRAVEGELTAVGDGWLLLAEAGREHLVPAHAVAAVEVGADGRRVEGAVGVVDRRLGLGHALRGLVRDRARVVVRAGGLEVTALPEAAGRDHLDVALLGSDGVRPSGRVLSVPFPAIDQVTRLG